MGDPFSEGRVHATFTKDPSIVVAMLMGISGTNAQSKEMVSEYTLYPY